MRVITFIIALFFVTPSMAQSIPLSYFGMHISEVTSVSPWPPIPFGTTRAWDACDSASNAGSCGTYPQGSPCSGSQFYAFWTSIETANGTFSWTSLDNIISKFQAEGDDIIYTLGKPPGWATGNGDCGAVPTDLNSSGSAFFNAFVTALVTRYKGRIKYYELWNEPNLGAGSWDGSILQMEQMAAAAYPIIKSIDPSAQVLSPATALSGGPGWMNTYLTDGGGAFFDIYSFHAYPWDASPVDPPEFITTIINDNEIQNATFTLNKPLFISEYSYKATVAAVPAVVPAVTYLLGWNNGVSRQLWYQYDNTGPIGELVIPNTGLNTAGFAYRAVTSWILGGTFTTPIARQAGANGVRNTTMSGASGGTPGTLPTDWQGFYNDSSNGISVTLATCTVDANNCLNWRVHGTATSGATGSTILCFEQDAQIAASNGQFWTNQANISLAAGSYTNVTTYMLFYEFPSFTFDALRSFVATGLASPQSYWTTGQLGQSGTTNVAPCVEVSYSPSTTIDITLQISTPSMDNGTVYQGSLTRANGAKSVIAWDSANGANGTQNFTTTSACGGTTCGNWQDITGQNNIAGSSVALTNSPVIFNVSQQPTPFSWFYGR